MHPWERNGVTSCISSGLAERGCPEHQRAGGEEPHRVKRLCWVRVFLVGNTVVFCVKRIKGYLEKNWLKMTAWVRWQCKSKPAEEVLHQGWKTAQCGEGCGVQHPLQIRPPPKQTPLPIFSKTPNQIPQIRLPSGFLGGNAKMDPPKCEIAKNH